MIRREIVKQYIESLKEDRELDYIFPLLLERMDYRVLSTPKYSKGKTQFGRDVIATKRVKGVDTLFHFELKGFRARDITDRSLKEDDGIIDSLRTSKYTPYRDASIPGLSEYPVKYVFVHNGGIDANVQPTWDGFVEKEFPNGELERWDLEKLTTLFSEFLFDETLLTDEESYKLFKKVLVMLDAEGNDYFPDIDRLIDFQVSNLDSAKSTSKRKELNFYATLRLIASMVYVYAKEANNLYPAKYCIDTIILKTWAWILKKGKEKRSTTIKYFNPLVLLQIQIYEEYINKILRFTGVEKGLYDFVGSDTEYIFYPLRCYGFLGDILYYFTATEAYIRIPKKEVQYRMNILKIIIKKNNACTIPLLDTHSIPILMLFQYMYLHGEGDDDYKCLVDYIFDTVINMGFRYKEKKMWPEMTGNRMALAKSLYDKSDDYSCDSSLLITVLFELISYMDIPFLYDEFKKIVEESGVNLQVAYPIQEEYDIEQLLFEHRLYDELSVETNIKLPSTLEEFKTTFKKKYKSINYRTDKVGYDFLRMLAHKHYETDLFPDFLGRSYCID